MKDSVVLKRSMFSDKVPKSVRNSGIMAGFEDDDMLQTPEDDNGMPSMARTPQNPEILMNTLRGDMRSVDARYQELAQMVGEKAAQETPPEVLAMLQIQLGQQGGIGSLPQGAGMMPPSMGGGAPMGAPGGAPAMPSSPQDMQGAMPPGMESAPPLPQGGADQAPPTPDGMPPMHAQVGAFVTPATRAAQFLADKAAVYGPRVNQYLGNLFMSPQPFLQRLTGGEPAMALTRQAGQSLVQNPVTGEITQGVGTKLAPYTTLGGFQSPTLTQGISQGLERLSAEYPRAASLLAPAGAMVMSTMDSFSPSTPLSPEDQARYDANMAQLAAIDRPSAGAGRGVVNPPLVNPNMPPPKPSGGAGRGFVTENLAAPTPVLDTTPANPEDDPLGAFITEKLKAQEDRDANRVVPAKQLTRIERIKAAQGEYTPLYQELLGDTAEDAKTNAMLLLADAGFKLASTYKPTFAMAVGEAAKDLPKGFANILAQARDRDIKVKTAALTQAISDVQEQDKQAFALQQLFLKGDMDLMKEQVKQGTGVIEDAGLGGRISKTKNGGFMGFSIDPNDPAVSSALRSRYTLRDTDNPYVVNRGEAPTTVETSKEERIKLGNALREIDNNLNTIDGMRGLVQNAYSPGTWFSDRVNNIFVPISGGMISPNFDTADAVTKLRTGFNSITKGAAAAAQSGRVSNQQEEWARQNAGILENPAGFFENPQLAAKALSSLETQNRNMRQQILTQLGYVKNDYVMDTPAIGTKDDPFVISSDPKQQQLMFNFLGSTVGRVQNPNAAVYLKLPNGRIDAFNPSQLRGLTGR